MIREPGLDPDFSRFLDELARGAEIATTESGLDFTVYDPEHLDGLGNYLVLGEVHETKDSIDADIFVSGGLPPETTRSIAEICFASFESNDTYSVARAAERVLGLDAGDGADVDSGLVGSATMAIEQNLQAFHRGLGNRKRGENLPKSIIDTYRATLGWVALRRPLRESGERVFGELTEAGLWIPSFDSDQRVSGLLQTKKGDQLKAGFMMMQERDERHACANCSGHIIKGSNRITLQLDEPTSQPTDHHHYHATCFVDNVLPKFVFTSLAIDTNPHAVQ